MMRAIEKHAQRPATMTFFFFNFRKARNVAFFLDRVLGCYTWRRRRFWRHFPLCAVCDARVADICVITISIAEEKNRNGERERRPPTTSGIGSRLSSEQEKRSRIIVFVDTPSDRDALKMLRSIMASAEKNAQPFPNSSKSVQITGCETKKEDFCVSTESSTRKAFFARTFK